ncbi:unnamed protein product [Fusarium graminearum]|uniref:Uncharacterized protein n=1 Tax=Gibberella zeae TaxID=5518 RepID=A0A4E9DRA0_GIBZA|nr:unnamed protein product [Fusarium graminearum]
MNNDDAGLCPSVNHARPHAYVKNNLSKTCVQQAINKTWRACRKNQFQDTEALKRLHSFATEVLESMLVLPDPLAEPHPCEGQCSEDLTPEPSEPQDFRSASDER